MIEYSNWYCYLFWIIFAFSNWYWYLLQCFSHSQTSTGTIYLYRLKFKGEIGLEMLMCLLKHGLYLNKSFESGIPVWDDQLVTGSDEIVKPISSFYSFFHLSCTVLKYGRLIPSGKLWESEIRTIYPIQGLEGRAEWMPMIGQYTTYNKYNWSRIS